MSVTALALLLLLPAQYPDWRPDPDRDLAQFAWSYAGAYECAEFAKEHCDFVHDLVALNCSFAWMNCDSPFWPPYQREARRRKDVWDALKYVRDPYNSRYAREIWAIQLYELLGAEAFALGKMPAPAPMLDDIWR